MEPYEVKRAVVMALIAVAIVAVQNPEILQWIFP